MPPIQLVLTDVDDTLYDWMAFYIPSFLAMLDEVHRITGLEREVLKRSFQAVHQQHGTTEYEFALFELDVLRDQDRGLSSRERLAKYQPAIDAFRATRRRTLRLFPGVRDTLEDIAAAGIPLVAVSDSMIGFISRRLRQLKIDHLFSAVCAPRDRAVPAGLEAGVLRELSEPERARTLHIELPPALRKPDPQFLYPVLERFAAAAPASLLVGDSLSRDLLLARRGGLVDVWARYGQRQEWMHYRELVKITYWTRTEVREEERLREEACLHRPTYVIDTFPELLSILASAHADNARC